MAVAGKRLVGWIVIDIDATVILSASNKAGAAVNVLAWRRLGQPPTAS